MVEAACRHGFAGATVTRVVELAGVSRATFYEHFGSREECFHAAYRYGLRRLGKSVEAVAEASDFEGRPAAVLNALLGQLADDPTSARMVLVEALAAPSAVREEHEGVIAEVERRVSAYLDEQPPGEALQIPGVALLGGILEALATRAVTGKMEEVRLLGGGLSQWMNAYRLPEGCPPRPQRHWRQLGRFAGTVEARARATPPLLPRGRSALPDEDAAQVRRERLLDATARVIAAEGYQSLTVARIAAAARVPRAAFYSHFEGKTDALLATQTHGLQQAMAVAAAEYSPPAPWPRRVWRTLRAFLRHVAEKPDYARLDFVESYAAGPAAVRHRQQSKMVFALFLEEGYRHHPPPVLLPSICSEAITGGIFALMRDLVARDGTEQLPSLLPAAAYTILAPFLGSEGAASRVQAWAREAP